MWFVRFMFSSILVASRTVLDVRVARPWNTVFVLVWIIEMSSPSFDRNMS